MTGTNDGAGEPVTEVPHYPDTRELELGDKPFFDALFARMQPRISEYCFAGLFLFRVAHAYRLTRVADSIVIFGRGYAGESYFLPPIGGNVPAVLTELFAAGCELYGADDPFREVYLVGPGLEVVADRNSFDYLYLRRDLAELPGNRYHKKRNRISYFASRHTFEVAAYGEAYQQGCLALLDEWERVHGGLESPSLPHEVAATREALRFAGRLGLAGVVVAVEGVPRAFALGERLSTDTSVCHFEKADPFMEGLSQVANREFSRLLFTDCTYVNREQDLGEQGLREAKLSYHPHALIRKYRARLQPESTG